MGSDTTGSLIATQRLLPQFPEFKSVELEDRLQIEALTAGFAPYAEFNFVEIWSWNSRDQGGWSCLNGNLVIRWDDVITGELFITFIGRHAIPESTAALIEYSIETGIETRLLAVPASVVTDGNLGDKFLVEDDRPNWDYLLSTHEWSTISGARFKNKRNAIHRLERYHQPELKELDIAQADTQNEMLTVFELWADLRHRSSESIRAELSAIRNLFVYAECEPRNRLYVVGAYVKNQLVGFSVNERLPDGFAIGHFAKADIRYDGIYPYLLRHVARYMVGQGIDFLNIEADLGDHGLAIAKHLCYPIAMLKKYSVGRRPNVSNNADGVGSASATSNGFSDASLTASR